MDQLNIHETTHTGDQTKEDGNEGDLLAGARELVVAGMCGVGHGRRGLLELRSLAGLALGALEERHCCERM